MNIIIKITGTLVLAVASATLGRMGGAEGYDKLWRRIGCMLCHALWLILFYKVSWLLIITMGLCYAALTTYFDTVPFNNGNDNHFMHGLAISLSVLPLVFGTGLWLGFTLYVVACTLGMGLWSKFNTHHVKEELGRYFIMIAVMPLLGI